MSLPPEPRANPDLFGHEPAEKVLLEAARSGRMHHAWLLAGPPGIGKATLAYRFARWLLAGMPPTEGGLSLPATNATFRRVASSGHADLRVLAPSAGEKGVKQIIRVDDVREVPRFLSLTSAEGGPRVVVVDGVETMNPEAQNALLKTLEEPPARAVLLMVTSAPDRLLPTIRSRCRRLDLHALEPALMEGLLARWLPDLPEAQRRTLIGIADGAPGQALTLAEGEGLALQAEVDGFLASLPHPDPRALHTLGEMLASKRDGSALRTFLDLLRRALAQGLREAGRGRAAPAWLGTRSLADWAGLWEMLGRLGDETETLNLDRKQAVLTGLNRLAMR